MPFTALDPSTAEGAPTTTAGAPGTVGVSLSEMLSEMENDLQGRVSLDTTRAKRWINWGYRTLAGMLDINELNASMAFPLVADQPFYLVPDSLAWIEWFGDTLSSTASFDQGRGFQLITKETYRTLPESVALGTDLNPYKYFRYARMVVLWPTPYADLDAAMDFRVRPDDLVEDEDCPILPQEFHEAIYQFGLARAQRKLGMREAGDRTYNDAIGLIRPLLNTDAQEKDQLNMAMQPIRSRSQLYRSR